MKTKFLCVIVIKCLITSLFAQKPIVTPLPALYRDANEDGTRTQDELVAAEVEITDIGFEKKSWNLQDTYFIEFKLKNTGLIDIPRATIVLQWMRADENTVLHTQDAYLIGAGDLPLDVGFDKRIRIYYSTLQEGYNLDSIRVSAFLEFGSYQHKLFPPFKMKKADYYVPISKKCKFEYTDLGYSSEDSFSGGKLLVGRVDYRLTNITNKELEDITLIFVWKNSETGEIFSETEEYISEKIAPNKTMLDYATSGKGYRNSTAFPFKITLDIFYEVDEQRIPIYSNLRVN